MSTDCDGNQILTILPGRLAELSPNARQLLDIVIDAWLRVSPHGQIVVAEMGHAGGRMAIEELLDCGGMQLKAAGDFPADPQSTVTLQLTDYGVAIGKGQVS